MSVLRTRRAMSTALVGAVLSLSAAAPAQGAARVAAVDATTQDVEDPWIALEDARILANEDPSRYAPRLREQLDALAQLAAPDRRALATSPSLLAQREKARLTLARALLNLGDEPAAIAQLEIAQREAHGADLQLGRLGPSLAALGGSLDDRRASGPRLKCGAPCVVVVEGRAVPGAGDGTSLGPLPPGTYDLWVTADGVDHDDLRRTFRVDESGASPGALVWPAADDDGPPSPAPGTLPSTFEVPAEGSATAATIGRRRAGIALAVLGGVLAGTGVALIAARPGCDQAPCSTAPAVLTGWSLIGAAIPTASAAVGLSVSVSRGRAAPEPSSVSVAAPPPTRSASISLTGQF